MSGYLDIKNNALKVIDNGIALARKAGYDSSIGSMDAIKERLKKSELLIVVCGEFKRGKSSLLSAFLEEKDLFPINVSVATNVVTVVRYGMTESIEVVFENNGKFESRFINRSEIYNYVTEQGNKNNNKKVNCLNIQIPNKILKEGLVLVDTPGVGSMNFSHSEVTYGYLPNADILLFVCDAISSLTDPELKFLQSAYKYCKNIIFPLTKIDKVDNYELIFDDNLEKICKCTLLPKDEIKLIPISNLAKEKYLQTGNRMMLISSRYQELEKTIWNVITDKRIEVLIGHPLYEFAQLISIIRNNLKVAYSSLSDENIVTMKELEEEFKKLQEEKKKLLSEGADWKEQLTYMLSTLNACLLKNIQEQQYYVEDIIEDFVRQGGINQTKIEELSVMVNSTLSGLAYDIKNEISDNINEIADDIYKKLGLSVNVNYGIGKIDEIEFRDPNIRLKKASKTEKAISLGRKMMMKGSGAAAILSGAGAVIGGAFGFLIAGPAGLILGRLSI